MNARRITIVVPVYDEDQSIEALVREIRDVSRENDLDVDIVFVDDGSRDQSWRIIRDLADGDPSIGGLRFRRNQGKAAALMAGFAAARGDVIITMDADLQDPPQEIPRLLARLDEGWDLVSGWKQVRHDPWHKVYPSRVFNRMISGLTGVHLHDHVCGLKCMKRAVAKELHLYGEFHRFIGVLAAARGFRATEIATLHRPRTTGVGKYGFTRFFKGFLDLITVWFLTRYRHRPQHVIGVAALTLAPVGTFVVLVSYLKPAWFAPLMSWLIMTIAGMTLIAVGLVAELIVAHRRPGDQYIVAERAGWCARHEDREIVSNMPG